MQENYFRYEENIESHELVSIAANIVLFHLNKNIAASLQIIAIFATKPICISLLAL